MPAAFRKLGPGDTVAYAEHIARLSPEDRSLRFAGLGPRTGRSLPEGAILYGAFERKVLRGVGELYLAGADRNRALAEGAFSVEGPSQDQGLGTSLLGRVVIAARNRGLLRLGLLIATSNGRMLRLARHAGGTLVQDADEVWVTIPLSPPNPATFALESLDTMAVMAAAARRWRPAAFPAGLRGPEPA